VEREPDIDAGTEAAEGALAARAPAGPAELAAIFAGGFIGAIARAALEQSLASAPASWPWPTFAVNIAAAALLGYAIAWLGERHPRTLYARAFLATGLCGALSTFSTVVIELIHLAEHGHWGLACAYAAASVVGGLGAVVLGLRLGARRGPAA
jgi:fluoride exporter